MSERSNDTTNISVTLDTEIVRWIDDLVSAADTNRSREIRRILREAKRQENSNG